MIAVFPIKYSFKLCVIFFSEAAGLPIILMLKIIYPFFIRKIPLHPIIPDTTIPLLMLYMKKR